VREEKKAGDPEDGLPALLHFQLSLKDLSSDAGSKTPGTLMIRACPKRRVAAKAEAMKDGWAVGQSIPVVVRDGKYVIIDANHRYHALWLLINKKYKPAAFNENMKLPCVELRGAPTKLVIQYANWLNTTQMTAQGAHQIDKLRFLTSLINTYGALSANELHAKLTQDTSDGGGTLGSVFVKGGFQTIKKYLGVLKGIGEPGLAEAERLNDLCAPLMLHSYYKQLIADCDLDLSELLAKLCSSDSFEHGSGNTQVECFLPDNWNFLQLGWGKLFTLQARCPLKPIDRDVSMPMAYAYKFRCTMGIDRSLSMIPLCSSSPSSLEL